MNYSEVEQIAKEQGKTNEARNLLSEAIKKCKREKKNAKEAFSTINQLIINPNSMGVC